MYPDPTLSLAGQLFRVAEVFYKTMAAEACARRIGLFGIAIWSRVKRFERRFGTLYAQWKAGTLPETRARKAEEPPPLPSPASAGEGANGVGGTSAGAGGGWNAAACDAASADRARLRPASVLPRTFAWLRTMLPMGAGTLAGGVDSLVRNFPEMQAFAADCPQVGRLLRPICRMAGIRPPDYLALPKRKRARKEDASLRLSEADEEELRRLTARFPDTPAARSAKRALRRMFAGLPVDLRQMPAVAVGYFLHPPRDGNCPPPEIGYGGRRRRPPKDYVRPAWD